MDKSIVSIDIVSDIVCPWCYVGYKRLERALSMLTNIEAKLCWQPFELNPDMPEEGQDLNEHMQEKYGRNLEQTGDSRQLLKAVGLSLGIEINSFPKGRIVNTFRAHQLMHWAALSGQEQKLQLALFEAYFSDGRDVNSIAVLKNIAAKVGLNGDQAEEILKDERYRLEVRKQEAMWYQRGVRAVPTYIFNSQFAISGAREAEDLKAVLDDLLATGKLEPTPSSTSN